MFDRRLLLALLVALAACSHGGGAFVPAAPSPVQGGLARARLVIKVPPCARKRCTAVHRGRYVSPATASLAYSVDNVVQTPISISTSNPACTVAGPVEYLTCTVALRVAPGSRTFSFTAKDKNGNALSANTSVLLDVKSGVANTMAVTLGGIAASLSIVPPNAAQVTGDQFHGYTIYGDTVQKFTATALDADGNYIVGPGAPQPRASATPASMTLAPAPSAAPNELLLASTYESTDPETSQSSSLTVVATPVPDSGGPAVSATVPLTLYQPWIYVVEDVHGTVKAFDEQGNPKTASGGFPNLVEPNGIAYDAHTGYLYVGNSSPNQVQVYDRLGNEQSTTMQDTGADEPAGIAYDSNLNYLYVTYQGASAVYAFNEAGVQQTLAGVSPFSGLSSPFGAAYVSAGNFIYVADLVDGVLGYDEQGNEQTLRGSFAGLSAPAGIAYDAHAGYLYVADNGSEANGTVTVYDLQGNQQTVSGAFPGLSTISPSSIAYDPNADWFYVGSCSGSDDVHAFDAQGNAVTTSSSWPGSVTGIAVVP